MIWAQRIEEVSEVQVRDKMKYCLKDIEKQYKVRLDDTQKSVLSSLIDFIESDKHTICLRSSAGTGNFLYI